MRAKLRTQFLRPLAQPVFVKVVLPVGGGGKFTVHDSSLMPPGAIANFLRKKRILFRRDFSVMLSGRWFQPSQLNP
jgi:hypothetical protein